MLGSKYLEPYSLTFMDGYTGKISPMCPGKSDLGTQYYPGRVGKTLPSVVSVPWPASWALASTPYLKRSNGPSDGWENNGAGYKTLHGRQYSSFKQNSWRLRG